MILPAFGKINAGATLMATISWQGLIQNLRRLLAYKKLANQEETMPEVITNRLLFAVSGTAASNLRHGLEPSGESRP